MVPDWKESLCTNLALIDAGLFLHLRGQNPCIRVIGESSQKNSHPMSQPAVQPTGQLISHPTNHPIRQPTIKLDNQSTNHHCRQKKNMVNVRLMSTLTQIVLMKILLSLLCFLPIVFHSHNCISSPHSYFNHRHSYMFRKGILFDLDIVYSFMVIVNLFILHIDVFTISTRRYYFTHFYYQTVKEYARLAKNLKVLILLVGQLNWWYVKTTLDTLKVAFARGWLCYYIILSK